MALVLGGAVAAALLGFATTTFLAIAPVEAPENTVVAVASEPEPIPGEPFEDHGLHLIVPPGWTAEPVWGEKKTHDVLRVELEDGRGNSAWVHDFRPRSRLTLDSLADKWVEVFYAGLEKKGQEILSSERVPFVPDPFLGDPDAGGIHFRAVRRELGEPLAFSIEVTAAELEEHEVFLIGRYVDADRDRFETALANLRASLRVEPESPPTGTASAPSSD